MISIGEVKAFEDKNHDAGLIALMEIDSLSKDRQEKLIELLNDNTVPEVRSQSVTEIDMEKEDGFNAVKIAALFDENHMVRELAIQRLADFQREVSENSKSDKFKKDIFKKTQEIFIFSALRDEDFDVKKESVLNIDCSLEDGKNAVVFLREQEKSKPKNLQNKGFLAILEEQMIVDLPISEKIRRPLIIVDMEKSVSNNYQPIA